MARPQKNIVDYYPHDAGASSGRTVSILCNHFGHEGISAWWQLLERLSGTDNHVIGVGNPEDFEFLAASMRFAPGRLRVILDKMAELEAIDKCLYAHGILWCQHLVDRVTDAYKRRNRMPPQRPNPFITTETALPGIETPVNTHDNPQTKLKETKLNKSKWETPCSPPLHKDNDNDPKKEEKGTEEKGVDQVDIPDLPDQDPLLARCVKVWEDNTAQTITPGVADGIAGLIEQYEPLWGDRDWFGDGVRTAFLAHRGAGGINLAFVSSILKRWSREGYPGKASDNTPESYELAGDMVAPNISVASAVEIAEGRKRANAYNTEAAIEGLRQRGIAFTPREHPD